MALVATDEIFMNSEEENKSNDVESSFSALTQSNINQSSRVLPATRFFFGFC